MISLLVTLLIICLIIGLVWWAIQQVPTPQPFRAVIIVVLVIICIIVLLQFIPGFHYGAHL